MQFIDLNCIYYYYSSFFFSVRNLGNTFPSPCGGCRQIISEFGYAADCVVIMVKYPGNECLRTTIKQLLPHAFTPDTLMKYTHAKSL